jgi:hypothetical protein
MTRSSAARRARRQGRRRGSRVGLMQDRQRFSLALWVALDVMEVAGPYEIASLVAVLLEESGPITIETIEPLVALSARYHSPAMTSFNSRIDGLVRKAREVCAQAPDVEFDWLVQSAGCIAGILSGDRRLMVQSLELLISAGWGEVLARLYPRIEAALRSNMPPFDENDLGRKGRRLLARLRQIEASRNTTELEDGRKTTTQS